MAIMTADEYAEVHMVRYPQDKPVDVARAYNRYKKIAQETQQDYERPAGVSPDEGPEDPDQVLPKLY